jgi:hypothetical protein
VDHARKCADDDEANVMALQSGQLLVRSNAVARSATVLPSAARPSRSSAEPLHHPPHSLVRRQ